MRLVMCCLILSPIERKVIVSRFILGISLVAFLALVGVSLAGASPEPATAVAGCHGAAAAASCHGDEPASCHGRTTIAQLIAARQTARQDARAAKRAAKASCHGDPAPACECECR